MPSATIHMCIAKKISKQKNINEFPFLMGNIVPDSWRSNNEENREKTHFSNKNDFNSENYLEFYEKYKHKINNPFVLGYLTHLITDYYYRKYVNCYFIIKVNDEKLILKLDGSTLPISEYFTFLRLNKFYLANELTNYYNLEKIPLEKIKDIDNPITEVNLESLAKSAAYLNENELINKVVKNEVFDLNKTLIDIESCFNFIMKELEKISI